jgi:phosphoserine phosphatase
MNEESKPVICLDLNGVLCEFDGRKDLDFFHPPQPGAREFLERLSEAGYRVVVFTAQWGPHVESWLARYGLSELVWMVTERKPGAYVYVDGQAICFDGDFEKTLEKLGVFETQWGPR